MSEVCNDIGLSVQAIVSFGRDAVAGQLLLSFQQMDYVKKPHADQARASDCNRSRQRIFLWEGCD